MYYRDDRESVRTLHHAVAAGVNFFDVSDHHTQGVAEEMLGKAFRGHRDEVIITTKAGYCYTPLASAELAQIATLQSATAVTGRHDEAGINSARGI